MFEFRDTLFELFDRLTGSRLHSLLSVYDFSMSFLGCECLSLLSLNSYLVLFTIVSDSLEVILRLIFVSTGSLLCYLSLSLSGVLIRNIGFVFDLRSYFCYLTSVIVYSAIGDHLSKFVQRLLEMSCSYYFVC